MNINCVCVCVCSYQYVGIHIKIFRRCRLKNGVDKMRLVLLTVLAVSALSAEDVPCDRSRKVLTKPWGIISDGPSGTNYTQDSHCQWLIKGNIIM